MSKGKSLNLSGLLSHFLSGFFSAKYTHIQPASQQRVLLYESSSALLDTLSFGWDSPNSSKQLQKQLGGQQGNHWGCPNHHFCPQS